MNSDISLISSKRLYAIELNNFNGKIHIQQTDKMFTSVVCMLDKKKPPGNMMKIQCFESECDTSIIFWLFDCILSLGVVELSTDKII